MLDYQSAWQFLDNLQFFKIKLGLDSMDHFLSRLDKPHTKNTYIHIGGTNGKGSTGAILASIMIEAGYSVGFYSSPHLRTVRERFRINHQMISKSAFCRHANAIIEILGDRQITYFEFTTTLAFLWFAEQNVDFAIMEVGMGGRLDATNVISPALSIITNVSFDHEAYLGKTIGDIAGEKAGIIKKGIPVVSGVSGGQELQIIQQRAHDKKAPLYLLGSDFFINEENDSLFDYKGLHDSPFEGLSCALLGKHQQENSALALAAVELLEEKNFCFSQKVLRKGLKKAFWPGRLERIHLSRKRISALMQSLPKESREQPIHTDGIGVILDGAHNPAGVKSLLEALQGMSYCSLICVWASMSDKDIPKSMLPLANVSDHLILTRPESERSAMPETLKGLLPTEIQERALCFDSVEKALLQAFQLVRKEDDLICVAGSLYLVGRARSFLVQDVSGQGEGVQ